ncbi:MAG: carotenoid biosynthesis protein [Armatimonadota bacterium]|nr:carotenoid biosynthesis protein [Armatimonadota bacterium]
MLWGGVLAAYATLWVGGVVVFTFGEHLPPAPGWTAPGFLALAALLTLRGESAVVQMRLLGVGVLGWAVEAVGVHTGFPFGAYSYTQALGPRLLGVPLAIGTAWMVLVAYATRLAATLPLPAAARVLVAAGWTTAIDLLLDPVAASLLGFWRWEGTGWYQGIPASNFAGWLGVSLLACALVLPGRTSAQRETRVGLSVVTFFGAIAVGGGAWVPALVGVLLCGAHAALYLFHLSRWRQEPSAGEESS